MVTRALYGSDPSRDRRRLEDTFSRLLQNVPIPSADEFPALNVYANQDGAIITSELPGVKSEDLDISVHRDALSIRFERRTQEEGAQTYHRRERPTGRFARILGLPFLVDPSKVEAELNDGLLTIRLQRAEEDKPKRINVKSRQGG